MRISWSAGKGRSSGSEADRGATLKSRPRPLFFVILDSIGPACRRGKDPAQQEQSISCLSLLKALKIMIYSKITKLKIKNFLLLAL